MMFWSRDTFLISGVTVADFRVLGTMPSRSDRLSILVRIGTNGSMSCLIIDVEIGSKLHDFAFDFCTIFLISNSVTAVNLVKIWGAGRSEGVMVLVFMLFVVDPSNFDLRLLILSKKYLLKVFAKQKCDQEQTGHNFYVKHDPPTWTMILHLWCFQQSLNESRNVWRFLSAAVCDFVALWTFPNELSTLNVSTASLASFSAASLQWWYHQTKVSEHVQATFVPSLEHVCLEDPWAGWCTVKLASPNHPTVSERVED